MAWGSGEFFLNQANGGAPVLARALWVGSLGYALYVALLLGLDPDTPWPAGGDDLRRLILNQRGVYGALVVGSYAAFYGRFASQWTHLANLYSDVLKADGPAATSLKVAFLVDAAILHLARKPPFVRPQQRWLQDPDVARHYLDAGHSTAELAAARALLGLPPEPAESPRDATDPAPVG